MDDPAPPANLQRLAGSLRELLRLERQRSASGSARQGWAEPRTREIDAAVAPGLALVERVLDGRPQPRDDAELPRIGRPIYRPLVAYALAVAGLDVAHILPEARRYADAGSAVGVWWAVVLHQLTGEASAVEQLFARQRANGEFFDSSPYDSPDLHWYDELVVLHAAAGFASRTGGHTDAVVRAARFHTAETQPDHATSQPWALHAFALSQDTYPLAELLLHGALAQNAGRLDYVSQLLLADSVLILESAQPRPEDKPVPGRG